jgi:glycosyltransferase involved in cell wall biosynthesis
MMGNFVWALQQAQGKYIALCEGDDYWTDPLKLQKQVDFLEANPEYGLVHTDVNHFYELNGKFIYAYNQTNNIKIPEGEVFEKLLPFSHIIKTKTVVARTNLITAAIKNINSYNQKFVVGDLPLWLELALVSKFKYLPDVTATYRLGVESASVLTNISKKIDFDNRVYELRMFYWSKYSKNPEIKERLEKDRVQLLIAHEQLKRDLKEVNLQILEYYSKNRNAEQLAQYLNNAYHNNDRSFLSIAIAIDNMLLNKNNEIHHLKEELNRYSSSTSYRLGNKIVGFFRFLKR